MGASLDTYFALNICSRLIDAWMKKPVGLYPVSTDGEDLGGALATVCMKWLAAEGREPPFDPQDQHVQGLIVRLGADLDTYASGGLRSEHLTKALNVIVHGNPVCVYVTDDDLILESRNPKPDEDTTDYWSVARLSMPSLLDGVRRSLGSHQQPDTTRMRQSQIIDQLFDELGVDASIRHLT
jgi:hypothetical protein